jgi:hypothetical protein
MDLLQSALLQKVQQCLKQVSRQQAWVRIFRSSMLGLLVSAVIITAYIFVWPNANQKVSALAALSSDWPFTILLCIIGLWLALSMLLSLISVIYLRSRDSKLHKISSLSALTPTNFLLHLNRKHVCLEESAHLLAIPANELSVPQSLQLRRILKPLADTINSPQNSWLPTASFGYLLRKNIYVFLLGLALLTSAVTLTTSKANLPPGARDIEPISTVKVDLNYLDNIVVKVSPPVYTQQPEFQQKALNISVLQGSVIQWVIPVDQEALLNKAFTLTISPSQVIPFVRDDVAYSATFLANIGAVYAITQTTKTGEFSTDIATVTVQQDRPPRITFKAPILTITEIPKNRTPSITALVEISDDFGITDLKIIASIAKGSGEAVKFRDQEFTFDSIQSLETPALYSKNWDLRALDMAPGDELYFSVHASDNKKPSAQKTVSPIKIIRWLEDEDSGISGAGIVLDFMPEYFKSQQQIIIETQALIAQTQTLDAAEFNKLSRGLGIAQSDLKQSYGQYLGDEFESGIMQTMETGPSLPDVAAHADDHSGEHASEQGESMHAEQAHEHENITKDKHDISGYQQAIEQFGHDHGEADMGFIKTSQGQINPKVLMKRAIAVMWQAELHLQLSQPSLALPFEKEALNYLNRAKQADRIYVKRLGFEPPPVTEERRYTGKLQDILSYQRDTNITFTPDQNSQFIALIVLLNTYLTLDKNTLNAVNTVTPETRALIDNIAFHLSNKVSTEPHWITQLATLKRIQLGNSFSIQSCLNCLGSLMSALSGEVSAPIAQPYDLAKPYSANHPAVKAYAEALLNNNKRSTREARAKPGNRP